MSRPLQQHPLWSRLDASSRQVLAAMAEPVAWRDGAELRQLTRGHAVLGWLDDAQALALDGSSWRHGSGAEAGLPAQPGQGWRIACAALQALLPEPDAYRGFFAQTSLAPDAAPPPAPASAPTPALRPTLGWLAAIGLPALILAAMAGRSDPLAQWLCFSAALGAGLCVWVLGLAPPVVGALLALLLMMAGNHLPVEQALAGFAGGSFFLLLGMFGCSTAIQHSGLMQRLLAALLRPLPHTARVLQACLALVGALMTLFIPSTSGRLQLMAPMVRALARPGAAGYPALAFAALSGCTLLSTAFLLGNPANFIVLGILPEHWQPHVNWMAWFKCAAVYTGVLACALTVSIVLGPAASEAAGPPWTQTPLPRLSAPESITALALLCLALGAALGNVHHIDMAWLALFVLLLLMATDVLPIDRLHAGVHWPILIYLVCTVGIARGFTYMGIQPWLLTHAGLLEQLMREQQAAFVLLLVVAVLLLRLVLPAMVCITTLCAVLMPLADTHGLNPLMLGFVIVTASEIWFLPHQSSDYLLFRESLDMQESEARAIVRSNARIQVCRIAALAASIPYWQHMGFLQ